MDCNVTRKQDFVVRGLSNIKVMILEEVIRQSKDILGKDNDFPTG